MFNALDKDKGGRDSIDLEEIRGSVARVISGERSYLVDMAKAEALDFMGERKAGGRRSAGETPLTEIPQGTLASKRTRSFRLLDSNPWIGTCKTTRKTRSRPPKSGASQAVPAIRLSN